MFRVWCALFLISINSASAVDLTLQAGANGRDVVIATLERLSNYDIFQDDNDFLRNIALVEAKYGTEGSGSSEGGIWRLPEWAFEETFKANDYKQLWEPYATMSEVFNFMWVDGEITYSELDLPLYSAIGARLFLLTRQEEGEEIPIDVDKQAEFWKLHYNHDGDVKKFIDIVNEVNENEQCNIALDIVFALDGSSTVGEKNFKRSKEFVIEVLDSIGNIGFGEDETRVSALQFSNQVWNEFPFDRHFSIERLRHAIRNITFHGGGTGTGLALASIRKSIFRESHGARAPSLGIPKVGVLVTDGKSNINFPVYFEAQRTHKAGITMYAIGVGEESEGELQLIASKPYNKHMFHVNDNNDLKRVKRMLQERSCTESAPVEVGQLVSGALKEGESKFLNYEPSTSEGLTLSFQMEQGSITVFTSSEIPNPNSANYDSKVIVEDRADIFLGSTSETRVRRNANGQSETINVGITANSPDARFLVNSEDGDNVDPKFEVVPETDEAPKLSFQKASKPGNVATKMCAPATISLVIAIIFVKFVNLLV